MAGHSKWKNIQHRKGAQDAKKAKMFTKVIKEISVAVKVSGPDVENNPRLRSALIEARSVNMPKDNIERAIKKASEKDAASYEEINYEAYGPGGVAVFIECATDNPVRTVSNVRSYFNKHGGSLGKEGCLQFVFDRKGVFQLKSEGLDEDEFTLEMIDAGAEDVEFEGENISITSSVEQFGRIQKKLGEMNIETESASLERIALDQKEVDVDTFKSVMKLVDKLEDDDDVQKVYHNILYKEEFEEHL